jgi:hypothetical protein
MNPTYGEKVTTPGYLIESDEDIIFFSGGRNAAFGDAGDWNGIR